MATVREMQRVLKLKLEELKQKDVLIRKLEKEVEKRDLLLEKLWDRLEKYKSILDSRKKFDALRLKTTTLCKDADSLNTQDLVDKFEPITIGNLGRYRAKCRSKSLSDFNKAPTTLFECSGAERQWKGGEAEGKKERKCMAKRVAISAEPISTHYCSTHATMDNLTKVPKSAQ